MVIFIALVCCCFVVVFMSDVPERNIQVVMPLPLIRGSEVVWRSGPPFLRSGCSSLFSRSPSGDQGGFGLSDLLLIWIPDPIQVKIGRLPWWPASFLVVALVALSCLLAVVLVALPCLQRAGHDSLAASIVGQYLAQLLNFSLVQCLILGA